MRGAVTGAAESRHSVVRCAARVDQNDKQQGNYAEGDPERPQPTRRAGIKR